MWFDKQLLSIVEYEVVWIYVLKLHGNAKTKMSLKIYSDLKTWNSTCVISNDFPVSHLVNMEK